MAAVDSPSLSSSPPSPSASASCAIHFSVSFSSFNYEMGVTKPNSSSGRENDKDSENVVPGTE